MAIKKIGDELVWGSQSGGWGKQKRGQIIAVAEPNQDIWWIVSKWCGKHKLPPPKASHIRAQDYSLHRRYIVAVRVDDEHVHFYAPLVSTIDNKLRAQKKGDAR